MTKTPAQLYDDFIKTEWQDVFRHEIHVTLDNGARYVPNSGSRGPSVLRPDANAWDEAIRIWSSPIPDSSVTDGYDRVVDQAGAQYAWEGYLIDPTKPWAAAVPANVRRNITNYLSTVQRVALARQQAAAAAARAQAEAKDDSTIALMNARRAADGKSSLTEEQEETVRANLVKGRA